MPESTFESGVLAVGESVFEGEYEVAEYVAEGNSGEVYRLAHPRHGTNRVLKLFVPFYQLRQAVLGQDDRGELTRQIIEEAKNQPYQSREYGFLSGLDHPYIVKVHDFGYETLTGAQAERLRQKTGIGATGQVTLPTIVAAYVDGRSFADGVRELDRAGVLRVLRSAAEALDYLHTEHELLHLDVKSGNFRVRPDGYPILLDFALSQDLSEAALEEGGEVKGGIDWDLTPFRRGTSGVADFIQRVQASGMPKREFKAEAFPGIDLYQFGLMLKSSHHEIDGILTPAESRYFDLLVSSLLDWPTARDLGPGQLLDLVRRIDATQFFLAIRPGSMSGGRVMPLSGGRSVFVSPKLLPVVEHPELTRLNRLNQLSLLPARFSGATHSRLEHSLDVLRLAQSAARRLLDDPTCRRLFTEADVEAMLAAALLHDINHLPLTHLYQESGLKVLGDVDLFREALETRHEGVRTLAETIEESLRLDPERIHRLIEGRWEEQTSPADQVISSVINSGIDLDKLSYLRLDSDRSGLGFAAGVDTKGVLESMAVVEWEKRDQGNTFIHRGFHIAFPEAALPLIEALVISRSQAFAKLYWCDDNRAMMAQFLACARAIFETEDGPAQLGELMMEVRADTDFAVLRRLDELAEVAVGRSWRLSQLFDTMGDSAPVLIYSATEPWQRIRDLSPAARLEFETRLREALEDTLPGVSSSPSNLMVDVPTRSLNLGGEILVIDRSGNVHRASELSAVVRAQEEALRLLASQVRIFVPTAVERDRAPAVGREDLERRIGAAIEDALGRSSFR